MHIKEKVSSQVLALMVMDALLVLLAGGLSLLLRFDFSIEAVPEEYATNWLNFLPLHILATLAVFYFRRMYQYVWRAVSFHDIADMLVSVAASYGAVAVLAIVTQLHLPRSIYILTLINECILMIGARCVCRFWTMLRQSNRYTAGERIMLIGAGEAGRMLLREIANGGGKAGRVVAIIDDDPGKQGKYLEAVKIVGGRETILETAQRERVTQIIFAIPTATALERRDILEICKHTSCRIRVLPEIMNLLNGQVSLAEVKDVQVEDLLGREPVQLDTKVLEGFLAGKTVMVTGGGGSIGSELCRQIARFRPGKLIVVDIYENNAYDIQQELRLKYGRELDLEVEIASVRDKERIYQIFETLRPQVVFHAAAHKHVPLMEHNPAEAVKNNIFGTYHVVRAAERFGAEKFVMISTDKAVNPTNFMGATKRFCEMILQSRTESPTQYCAVRFGNVLGSNGSVVPLFKRQIAGGGPITITDKRIIRYFMTIPEAAQLVLEAGAIARQSQIFVLDMGEPVKILTLAENLIRLSGLTPYQDIDIREIGLRPGEKLYEELLMKSEKLTKTKNKKIFIEQQEPIDPENIMVALEALDRAVTEELPGEALIALLRRIVPTYKSPEEVNAKAEQAEEMAAV